MTTLYRSQLYPAIQGLWIWLLLADRDHMLPVRQLFPRVNLALVVKVFPKLVMCFQRYDMNGRCQMQGGKNWILPKQINANQFFWDSHWLEIWSNHLCPYMGPNGGSVAMDCGWQCYDARQDEIHLYNMLSIPLLQPNFSQNHLAGQYL